MMSKALEVASSTSYIARMIFYKPQITKIKNDIQKFAILNCHANEAKLENVTSTKPVQGLKHFVKDAHSHTSHHPSCMNCRVKEVSKRLPSR